MPKYDPTFNLCRQERKKYYLHREKARSQSEKYLTIIIDGMDQNKTNVPALMQETKSTQNLYRVCTHLTGALVHTRFVSSYNNFVYTDKICTQTHRLILLPLNL